MQKVIIQAAAAILIAVAAYFGGAVTDVGGALDIALDEQQKIEYCKNFVTGDFEVNAETE